MNLLPVAVLLVTVLSTVSSWDFAVTTKNKISFYDENWSLITQAAHEFDGISAITVDETDEIIYFNDQKHENGSLFTLKLSIDEKSNHITENILSRTKNETIAGIAYDPLDRILYWTDATNKKIYKLPIDIVNEKQQQQQNTSNIKPIVLFDFTEEDSIPDGISIDICNRKLYWTNSNHKNPTIERSFLNGTQREIIINSSLYLPHGIIVDPLSDRIYWVVDQQGSHYSVESSNLDGSDRQWIVKGLNNVPFNLAVTRNSIYWTDLTHRAIWNVSKNSYQNERPNKIQVFSTPPKGIIAKINFLTKMENDVNCKDIVKKIKNKLFEPLTPSSSSSLMGKGRKPQMPATHEEKDMYHRRELFCLNKGEYNPRSGTCICKVGFTGIRCEKNTCTNFCVHGTCSISSMGFPECICQEGFNGERCENSKCTNYCLNDGKCEIKDNVPVCHCTDSFSGKQCEQNTTEICSLFCELRRYDEDREIPFGCYDICDEIADSGILPLKEEKYSIINKNLDQKQQQQQQQEDKSIPMCSNIYNKTIIFVVFGILTALILVFLIIQTLRRIYKPARPRIKKTFVVQKKVSQTPLTSRPLATEQCEITIENCCNMNICDTPCFDPKLLQQNMSFDKSAKEDKKILINNMEEDLY